MLAWIATGLAEAHLLPAVGRLIRERGRGQQGPGRGPEMADVHIPAHPRLLVEPDPRHLAGDARGELHAHLVRPIAVRILGRDVRVAPDAIGRRRGAGRGRTRHVAVRRIDASQSRDNAVVIRRPGGQARLLERRGAARRVLPTCVQPVLRETLLDQVTRGAARGCPGEIDLARGDRAWRPG